MSHVDSNVPDKIVPSIPKSAQAQSASARSLGSFIHPSATITHPICFAIFEQWYTALNCGLPTPVIIRVVHIAHGPIPTFTQSAPASKSAFVPSIVHTFQAIRITSFPNSLRKVLIASIIVFWYQCAVSSTKIFTQASLRVLAFSRNELIPRAIARLSFPL